MQGAVELLQDHEMDPGQRRRFLDGPMWKRRCPQAPRLETVTNAPCRIATGPHS
ncbi:hypothetical protein [Brevundimonas sp.]|uniref:hypothetical protein n=1 Tax=Brevundimonas sp. TaxID=1871086 RepID=UPI0034531C99